MRPWWPWDTSITSSSPIRVAAGAGYNKHHGSVDAAPLGVIALRTPGRGSRGASVARPDGGKARRLPLAVCTHPQRNQRSVVKFLGVDAAVPDLLPATRCGV